MKAEADRLKEKADEIAKRDADIRRERSEKEKELKVKITEEVKKELGKDFNRLAFERDWERGGFSDLDNVTNGELEVRLRLDAEMKKLPSIPSYKDYSEAKKASDVAKNAYERAAWMKDYSDNWTEKTGFKVEGKLAVGDGEVGNGSVKNGKLYLSDDDVQAILKLNSIDTDYLSEVIENSKGDAYEDFPTFAPFVGKNNTGNSDMGFNSRMRLTGLDVPDAEAYDVEEWSGGSPRTWEDPGEPASGSVSIGRGGVDVDRLHLDYEKASGMKVDRASIERLAKAITRVINSAAESVEENINENFDWEGYADDKNSDRGLE